jgi:hypothetical protein
MNRVPPTRRKPDPTYCISANTHIEGHDKRKCNACKRVYSLAWRKTPKGQACVNRSNRIRSIRGRPRKKVVSDYDHELYNNPIN